MQHIPAVFPTFSGISSTLLFHGFYTHVPIRQAPVTTGQSEPADNKNGEGPRSEITGHGENEGCGTTETETLNRESKLAERLETVLRALELRDVVLTCGFCGHVLNVHADYILMRRTETRWERGYMMTLMSFSSFPRKLKA